MEIVTFNGELILTLKSKQDWISKMPQALPPPRITADRRVFLDKNGNCLAIGEDFSAAEKLDSYPVRVYSLQRVAEVKKHETLNTKPETEL